MSSGSAKPAKITAETGWSSSHDRERKLEHDFANTVTELLFAAEAGERQLVDFCVTELRERYAQAVRGRA